ncbi:MAG: hypothetical protein H0X37_10690 [Herpetosiphonaceae bacterium]|nr:hypothetical protein [Herpetosiphonaceae bacterium]
MNNVGGSLQEMVNSSILVLTQPSVPTFERFERRGNLQKALIYIAVAAIIAGIFGLFGGPRRFIGQLIAVIVNFLVFTYATYYIGQRQGGTGTLDEVAYTFSLFVAPLQVIGSILGTVLLLLAFIPIINVLAAIIGLIVAIAILVFEIRLGHMAVESSMNITDSGRAWRVLIMAAVATFIVSFLISAVFRI